MIPEPAQLVCRMSERRWHTEFVMASLFEPAADVCCAGQAPRSPVLAQHVVLPVLHILLDAMGADATQSKERSQRSRSGPTSASPQPATSSATASSAAGGGRSPSPAPGAGAAPPESSPLDVSLAESSRGDVERSGQRTAQRPQVLVSFSDFMSGRAGLADYLARRAHSAAADSRPADDGGGGRAQQLMMKYDHGAAYVVDYRHKSHGRRDVLMVCMCQCGSRQGRCQDPSCLHEWHSTALIAQPCGQFYRFARRWQRVVAERRASDAAHAQPAASGAAQSDAVGLDALLSPAAGGLLQQLLLCTSCQVTKRQLFFKPQSAVAEDPRSACNSFCSLASMGGFRSCMLRLGATHDTPQPRQCVPLMRVSVYPHGFGVVLQEVRSTTALLLTAVCRGDSGTRLADRLSAMLPAAAAAGAHPQD